MGKGLCQNGVAKLVQVADLRIVPFCTDLWLLVIALLVIRKSCCCVIVVLLERSIRRGRNIFEVLGGINGVMYCIFSGEVEIRKS